MYSFPLIRGYIYISFGGFVLAHMIEDLPYFIVSSLLRDTLSFCLNRMSRLFFIAIVLIYFVYIIIIIKKASTGYDDDNVCVLACASQKTTGNKESDSMVLFNLIAGIK